VLSERDWRKIQALQDFQQAWSSFLFLEDLPSEISQEERWRFRCYHDAAVISYCRPFTQSKGLPTLSFKAIGIEPASGERALHHRIIEYRNKVVAHTDTDRMSLVVTSSRIWEGVAYVMPRVFEDVGFEFADDIGAIVDWLRKIMTPLATFVFDLMQTLPPGVRIDKGVSTDHRRFGPTDQEIKALGERPGSLF
jgi:hypothetical protein